MKTFDITLDLPFEVPQTDRAGELIRMFGLTPDCIHQQHLTHTCRIDVHPGDIVYITGASGAGKTVLLHAMYDQIPPDNRLRLDDIPLHDDRPLIDCFERPVLSTTELLSRAGLSDVFSLLQSPAALSAGQQYRYRMARAMTHPAGFIFADEFTGTLDRMLAGRGGIETLIQCDLSPCMAAKATIILDHSFPVAALEAPPMPPGPPAASMVFLDAHSLASARMSRAAMLLSFSAHSGVLATPSLLPRT